MAMQGRQKRLILKCLLNSQGPLWQPCKEVAHLVLLSKMRLGQSDGGSAFDPFQAGIVKVRGSGDPLIEPLAFFFVLLD